MLKMKPISEALSVLLFLTVCASARDIRSNVTGEQVLHDEILPNTTSEYALNHTEQSQSTKLTTNGQDWCDCGSFGRCSIIRGEMTCVCYRGYSLKREGSKLTCARCNCGEFSKSCEFQGSTKVCTCKDTAAVLGFNLAQTCIPCDCGYNSANCTINKDTYYIECNCLPGFEYRLFQCQDIDECKSPWLYPCPANTECYNTHGSYRCECKPGFRKWLTLDIELDRCEDINECERVYACDYLTETCVNTIGSYYCKCMDHLEYEAATNKCRSISAARPWRTAYIVLSIIIIITILCLLLYIRKKYFSC